MQSQRLHDIMITATTHADCIQCIEQWPAICITDSSYRQTGWQSYGAPSGVEWEKEGDGEETERAYQNAWRHVAATAAAAPACSGKPRTIGVWYPMIRRHDIHSRPVWTEPTVKKWWGSSLATSTDLDNNKTFV